MKPVRHKIDPIVKEPRRSFGIRRQTVSVLTLSLRQVDDRLVDIRWTQRILRWRPGVEAAIAPT